MWISKWNKQKNGDNQQREDNSFLAGGTTKIEKTEITLEFQANSRVIFLSSTNI